MTTLLQLNPTLPVTCPKGRGAAHFLLDYGEEHHVLWGVVVDEGGEVWWCPNPEVRVRGNWSAGRTAEGLAGMDSLPLTAGRVPSWPKGQRVTGSVRDAELFSEAVDRVEEELKPRPREPHFTPTAGVSLFAGRVAVGALYQNRAGYGVRIVNVNLTRPYPFWVQTYFASKNPQFYRVTGDGSYYADGPPCGLDITSYVGVGPIHGHRYSARLPYPYELYSECKPGYTLRLRNGLYVRVAEAEEGRVKALFGHTGDEELFLHFGRLGSCIPPSPQGYAGEREYEVVEVLDAEEAQKEAAVIKAEGTTAGGGSE